MNINQSIIILVLCHACNVILAQNSNKKREVSNNYIKIETYQLITPAKIIKKESPAEYRRMPREIVHSPDSTAEKRYKTIESHVLVKSAANYFETIAPEFKIEIAQFLTEDPKNKKRKYKKITEQVLIKPEHEIFTVSEPIYKKTIRSRLTKEASAGIAEEHEEYAFAELVKKAKFEVKLIPAEYLEITHWVKKNKKKDDCIKLYLANLGFVQIMLVDI